MQMIELSSSTIACVTQYLVEGRWYFILLVLRVVSINVGERGGVKLLFSQFLSTTFRNS